MERHLEGKAEPASVLRLFDNVGDILNAENPCDHKRLRRGNNVSTEQEAILDEAMRKLVRNAHRQGEAHMCAFQRDSCALCQRQRAELSYILTSQLTQDFVESFFSQVSASVVMEEDSSVYLSTPPLRDLGDAEEPAEPLDEDLQEINHLLEAAEA
ncbi:hypothetical protein FJT64_008830 [Amphibalanus amphitrite]|uniref:Uncharacterized protein n=1 Tax=Amphibalanus amphitrite TaxID=1232801 RepID=A0A6A4VP02_AMPAM|nr:hypothetical protein FJT64_008830 [Amphibalanus amphitrite]